MAKTRVVAATGPVEFPDGTQQVSLPLTALFFDNGVLKASGPLYMAPDGCGQVAQVSVGPGPHHTGSAPPPKLALLRRCPSTAGSSS